MSSKEYLLVTADKVSNKSKLTNDPDMNLAQNL